MNIHCSDLLGRLGDEELLVIDCRAPEDWHRYPHTIPGALRLCLAELAECAHILPDDEMIVLAGWGELGIEARRAQRLLTLRGRNAYILDGGLRAWLTAGYPTESVRTPGEGRALTFRELDVSSSLEGLFRSH